MTLTSGVLCGIRYLQRESASAPREAGRDAQVKNLAQSRQDESSALVRIGKDDGLVVGVSKELVDDIVELGGRESAALDVGSAALDVGELRGSSVLDRVQGNKGKGHWCLSIFPLPLAPDGKKVFDAKSALLCYETRRNGQQGRTKGCDLSDGVEGGRRVTARYAAVALRDDRWEALEFDPELPRREERLPLLIDSCSLEQTERRDLPGALVGGIRQIVSSGLSELVEVGRGEEGSDGTESAEEVETTAALSKAK